MQRHNSLQKASRGIVASMINNFNGLEYTAGKTDKLPPLRSSHTLTSDHPAQRPMADRPVPYPDRPELRHIEEQENPFKRRNSSGSSIQPTPPEHRERISHRAFERVRTASLSPSPNLDPISRRNTDHSKEEADPFSESAQAYITRKLMQRWSPPSARSSPPPSSWKVPNPHVENILVQNVLDNIDEILSEHTETLKSVIKDSRRMLHHQETSCYPIHNEHSGRHSPPSYYYHPASHSSSIPDLLAAVDQTATHLGLSLPDQHTRHPDLHHVELSSSDQGDASLLVGPPVLAQPRPTAKSALVRHSDTSFTSVEVHHHQDSSSPVATPAHTWIPSQPHIHGHRQRSSFPPYEHSYIELRSSHNTLQSKPSYTSTQSRHSGYSQHAQLPGAPPPEPPPTYPSIYVVMGEEKRPVHPQERSSSSEGGLDLASPGIIEYDRDTALADRATSNSLKDAFIDTSVMNSRRESVVPSQSSGDRRNSAEQESTRQTIRKLAARTLSHLSEEPPPPKAPAPSPVPPKRRFRDSWITRPALPSTKVERRSTMDRVKERGGYEDMKKKWGDWESRIDDAIDKRDTGISTFASSADELPFKLSKRRTGRMVGSAVTRQGRDSK